MFPCASEVKFGFIYVYYFLIQVSPVTSEGMYTSGKGLT